MMQSVVLDGNLSDEVVNLVYLQSIQKLQKKESIVCARRMSNKVCNEAYAGLFRRSRICTWKRSCQVAYAQLRSKFIKPGVTTMVLTHCIERWIVYLIPSMNTTGSNVVLTHGIEKC